MKLEKIVTWLDQTLNVAAFDDVSNNGLQVSCRSIEQSNNPNNRTISTVAFAVDASVRAVKAAAKAGAQLLVVHHGISWGGGIKRIEGGVYNVVKAAMDANLAIYACHLPLDAHPVLGNNAQLAKLLGLKRVKPAFSYHGNVIGLVGKCSKLGLVGICSGGAGEFAEEAKRLGCDLYLTGEASWGDVIAAENCGMEMICAGHYETEVFGVRAVAEKMGKALKLKVVDLTEKLRNSGERFSARKHSAVAAVLLALTALSGLGSVDNPDPSTFGGNAYHDGGWISYGTDINQKNGYLQFDSGSDYVYSPHYAAPIRKIMMETRCSSSSYPTRFLTVMPYVQGVEAPSLAVTNAVFEGKDKLTVVSFDFSASAGVDAFRLGMTGGTGYWGITRLAVFHGEKTDDEEALLREFAQQLPVPENLTLTGLASSSLSVGAFPVEDAVGYCFELTRLTGFPRTELREDFVAAPNLSSGWTCDAKTEGLTLSDGAKTYSDSAAGDEHALKVDKATNPKEGPVELGLVSPVSPEPISEWSFVGRFGALDKSNYFIVYGRTDASAEWTELATGLTPDKQQSNKLFSGTVDTALNIHQIRFVLAANADSWTTTGLDSLCVVYGGNEER